MIKSLDSPIKCFVRNEYTIGEHGYTEGLIIAITCEQSRQPTFTVLLSTGAKYDPIPVSGICWKFVEDSGLHKSAWWDCLSDEFNVEQIKTLVNMPCRIKLRDGSLEEGNYVLTIKFKGGWSDIPSEHKVFDLIRLKNGNFAWTINNKTIYLDDSFVEKGSIIPKYLRNNNIYTVE
jgi:hypothetical protein